MYICISLNPAIDKRLRVARLKVGAVNRAESGVSAAGGKAAHVALALKALSGAATWIGLAGGAAGEELCAQLSGEGVAVTRVETASETRVNLEIIEENGSVTEVLEPGGHVTEGEIEKMTEICGMAFREAGAGSSVVISGSLPPGVSQDYLAELIHIAHAAGCKVFVDLSGERLLTALTAQPDFAKPNREEAQALLGNTLDDAGNLHAALFELRKRGARSAAISLDADGLVWLPEKSDVPSFAKSISVPVISTVGCGDATVAGFVYASANRMSIEDTMRLAVGCGAANCQAELPGRIDAVLARSLAAKVEFEPRKL